MGVVYLQIAVSWCGLFVNHCQWVWSICESLLVGVVYLQIDVSWCGLFVSHC